MKILKMRAWLVLIAAALMVPLGAATAADPAADDLETARKALETSFTVPTLARIDYCKSARPELTEALNAEIDPFVRDATEAARRLAPYYVNTLRFDLDRKSDSTGLEAFLRESTFSLAKRLPVDPFCRLLLRELRTDSAGYLTDLHRTVIEGVDAQMRRDFPNGLTFASDKRACQTITGLDLSSKDRRGFVVGDMHGTNESPAFVEALVCQLLANGHGVALAVEMPQSEQAALDTFLADADPGARARLLAAPFWHRPMQDGRSSAAVLRMLDRMRSWKQEGRPLRVIAFDPSIVTGTDANARDAGMADALRPVAQRLQLNEQVVVFVGNAHARKVEGSPFKDVPLDRVSTRPLGFLLRDLNLTHLDVHGDGGSAWVCTEGCGVKSLRAAGPAIEGFRIAPPRQEAFDGEYQVGPFTASPPAIGEP